MTNTIKEQAEGYVSATIKTIADLEVVKVDMTTEMKTFKEGTADEFKANVTTIDGGDYRVPNSVLKSLKAILKEKPDLKTFKVVKTGEGLQTEYTVIPLE